MCRALFLNDAPTACYIGKIVMLNSSISDMEDTLHAVLLTVDTNNGRGMHICSPNTYYYIVCDSRH